ncbi:MAG: DUF4058 family protein [Armatimonadetes bacterium]|nr:DUF4058 family protein [Armatimonadota bacterium]
MPSPFPGMDPYIEEPEVWSDFHGGLAEEIRAELNRSLLNRYVVRLGPRVTYDLVLYTVEVRETGTLRLVTAIEILSPVNKRPGHDAYRDYRAKRRELLRTRVHLIEIDLLRGGERPPLERPVAVAPYYVTVNRSHRRPYVEVWPIQLSESLPVVPVPLLEPDPDAALDPGAVVAAVYDRGAYARLIDYRRPPPPPALTGADAIWLDERLRA